MEDLFADVLLVVVLKEEFLLYGVKGKEKLLPGCFYAAHLLTLKRLTKLQVIGDYRLC